MSEPPKEPPPEPPLDNSGDPYAANRSWDQFMEMGGQEFEFRVGRGTSTVLRDGPQATFSREAYDTLMQHLAMYVGTRVSRFYDQRGVMPQQVNVRVKVGLNEEPADWLDEDDPNVQIQDLDTNKHKIKGEQA